MKRFLIGVVCTAVCYTGFVKAQTESPDVKQKFAQAQKENSAAMQRYSWKSRTELKLKGESKKVKVEQVRYGADGKLQKITLQETQPQQQQMDGRRGGRIKQKIIENKKEEFAELMQQLAVVAQSYAHIPAEQMQTFLQNAQFSIGKAPFEGTLQISGGGALQPEDSLNIWIDKQTLMLRRIEVNTSLDKKPVHMTSEYLQMTNGPNFQSRATLEYPEKQIQLTVNNFDHQPL